MALRMRYLFYNMPVPKTAMIPILFRVDIFKCQRIGIGRTNRYTSDTTEKTPRRIVTGLYPCSHLGEICTSSHDCPGRATHSTPAVIAHPPYTRPQVMIPNQAAMRSQVLGANTWRYSNSNDIFVKNAKMLELRVDTTTDTSSLSRIL